jgi:hypothetical protein
VVTIARSMLKAKGLPGWFWGEAVNAAVYVLNRCPLKSVDGMTPFEAWHGRKPVVHHLRTFRCIMYVRNTTPHLKKLEDRDRKMIFVGYESGSKAYRAYDPITKCVHVTRDVVFNEQAQWDWGSGGDDGKSGGGDDVFTMEYTTMGPVAPMADGADEAPTEESPLPAGAGDTEVDDDVWVRCSSPNDFILTECCLQSFCRGHRLCSCFADGAAKQVPTSHRSVSRFCFLSPTS